MKPIRALPLLLLASIGLASACGDDSSEAPSAAPPEAEVKVSAPEESGDAADATNSPRPRGPLVRLRDSQFGPVLFNGSGRALYLFTRDETRSRCYGDCAVAWPPLFARGKPRAGRGVDPALLGTIKRRGGRRQVTYRGQPLYFYVHDPRGQVLCNDVVEFGGTWYALTAAGRPPA